MGPIATAQVFERHESAVRGYCRRFNAVFKRATGSQLVDAEGRSYIDFLAGCGALNYGHNDPDMAEALVAHIRSDGLCAGLDLHTEAKAEFLSLFQRLILAPRGLDHRLQFTGPTGANAVEAALKLARKVTGRQNVIAFTNGYHGVSLGALAATGNQYNRMGMLLPGVTRMAYDGYHGDGVDTADQLARLLDDPSGGIDAPAAFILEVVQGEGGLNMASAPWLQKIAALAQRHGALLIVDDVQAGCGRTGRFFSFEGMGVTPDLVVLSKSISGFGLPMSLLLVRPQHDQWGPAEHNGTFRGNNHAFVTAAVTLRKYWSDERFSAAVVERGLWVAAALEKLVPLVPGSRVKGRGMFCGLDLADPALAERVIRLCWLNGLVIEAAGPRDEVIKVMAPLNTPISLLSRGLDVLSQAVRQAVQERTAATLTAPVVDAAQGSPISLPVAAVPLAAAA